MAARAFWKGKLKLNSTTVPIALYAAVTDRSVHFHILEKESKVRVKQHMINPHTNEEIPRGEIQKGYQIEPGTFVVLRAEELEDFKPEPSREIEITNSEESGRDLKDDQMVRGYEIEKGTYVPVTDEELEKLAPEKSRDIDMRRFVDKQSIPPIYFERAYFLTPGGDTEKAYRLLAKTMEDSDRVGVGTFVMRGKEYLVAIFAENGILHAQTLRFADELRSPSDIGLPKKKKLDAAAVKRFQQLIRKQSKDDLSTTELKDKQTDRVLKLVKAKHSRGKDVIETEEEKGEGGNVVDIMDVLKQTLAAKAGKR